MFTLDFTKEAVLEYLDQKVVTKIDENATSVLYRLKSAETTCILATANTDTNVTLQIFSHGKLFRTTVMGYEGRRWSIVSNTEPMGDFYLKNLLPLCSKGPMAKPDAPLATKTDRTNTHWSDQEYKEITEMFATLVISGYAPDTIDDDLIQQEFGKVIDRNAGAINTRLGYLSSVLVENKGMLSPTLYDYHLVAVNKVRDLLRDLALDVWEGEWSCIRPKVKVTVDTLADKVPSLTKLGKKVSMNVDELEALLAELQK